MRHIFFLLTFFVCSSVSIGQTLQARIDVPEKIEGLCNQDEYYHLMNGMGDQTEAVCPLTLAQIYNKLVAELNLEKEFPKFKGSDGVNVSINCNGEVILVEADFKDERLNQKMREIFASLGEWKTGTMLGKKVDSAVLYAIKIKKGKLKLNENVWKK